MGRIEELESFVDIVEMGGISKAAQKQGVAKSAVSRKLADLEARLGTQLLFRTTRRMSLTESGRQLYSQAVEIIANLDGVENEVADDTTEISGLIRMALPLSFGIKKMSEPVARFHEMHPNLQLDIDFNDRRTDLVREGYDLAIRIGELDDSSLRARHLFQCKRYVCARTAFMDRVGRPNTIDELSRLPAALYMGNREARWDFIGSDGVESVRVKSAVVSNNGEFLVDYAKHNDVVVRMPSFLVDEAIHNGELEVVLPQKRVQYIDVWAVYPDTRHLANRVRHLIDYITEYFSETPEWERYLP